ncbi:STAS domain-containing protein [Streptomyces sp. NPDC054855]
MTETEMTGTEDPQPSGGLSVVATATDGIRVLSLSGEIDHHSGAILQQALNEVDAETPRVVVDLRRVTFMDSSGINILLAAHHTLTEAGGWLRLAAPNAAVKRTLSIVGVETVIDCHDTLRQALT